MNWEWLIAIVILTLVGSFAAVVLWSIVNAAQSNAHKRRLELIEAERLRLTVANGAITVNAHNHDPKAVAEAVMRLERELNL
ncbi:hypothetical protein SEA_PUREGLOBE5_76 [Arthrobacter phage Pureglobe5]|nr:hypothetical protein PBI_BEAGLE_78 [Arthrobacter phage Beagle]QOP66827.1 hypothetical protein SEA_ODYSSEY395_78 [Arthrobacter phage Odyssey395]UYL87439.1 hypothetical protein SEA_PUREGLOBE5_76 [Arthrobacter phage Pureglobe5]